MILEYHSVHYEHHIPSNTINDLSSHLIVLDLFFNNFYVRSNLFFAFDEFLGLAEPLVHVITPLTPAVELFILVFDIFGELL